MSTSFASDLEAHGYFRGLPEAEAQTLKADLAARGWIAIFGESNRCFHADAEDLAEGGISRFIAEIAPFLSAQGIEVPTVEDVFTDQGYSIRIGNRVKTIYGAAELKRDIAGEYGLMWGLASVRAFALIDDFLESAGSPERIYAVNGGNDLGAYFLTPDLHRIIAEQPGAIPSDGPYKLKAEYPTFGCPK